MSWKGELLLLLQMGKEESGGNQTGVLVQERCLEMHPPTPPPAVVCCCFPPACKWASSPCASRKGQWEKSRENMKLCLSHVLSGLEEGHREGLCGEKVWKNTAITLIAACLSRNNQTCDESCDLSDLLTELQLKRFTIKGCRLLLLVDF